MPDTRKSVLVTGCSPRGIGNALARSLHAQGLRVIATARNLDKIRDLETELAIECLELAVDDQKSVRACFGRVQDLLDGAGLDYLINNAGILFNRPAVELDMDEVRSTFEVNVFGVMDINQTFLPLLLRAQGTIVHIGSVASFLPVPWHATYCASKAALYAYCDTLRIELAPFKVKVVYVQTGNVLSKIHREPAPLADDSLYSPIAEAYKTSTTDNPGQTDTAAFADGLTRKILRGNGWIIYEGGGAGMSRFVNWAFSATGFDIISSSMASIYKLSGIGK